MQVYLDELSLGVIRELSSAVWALVDAIQKAVPVTDDKEAKDAGNKVEGVQDQS